MKLVTFRVNDAEHIGFLINGKVIDMKACYDAYLSKTEKPPANYNFANMVSFLRRGESAIELVKNLESFISEGFRANEKIRGPKGEKVVYDEEDVKFKAPLIPSKLILMGGTYPTHSGVSRPSGVAHKITREELIKEVLEGRVVRRPIAMFFPSSSVTGPDEEVFIPAPFEKASTHHELTLVIGKRGHNIPRKEVYDHIVGYTILNDITIRDIYTEDQMKKHGWHGFPEDKAYDTTAPLGPHIVTKDEILDPHNLNLDLKVNGKTILKGNTGDMTILWDIPKIVEHCSRICTLEVGDVIATGAPGPLPGETDLLKTGDIIEAWIEGIGCLRNTIKFEVDVNPSTRTRRRAPELALPNDGNQYV